MAVTASDVLRASAGRSSFAPGRERPTAAASAQPTETSAVAARGETDGRFTAQQATRQLAHGMKDHFVDAGREFRRHPALSTALGGGLVATAFAFPLLSTILAVVGLGAALLTVGTGAARAAINLARHRPDAAEKNLATVGNGIANLAVWCALSGLATLTHVFNAVVLQPVQLVDSIERLPARIGRLWRKVKGD